jgi:hypothetical protein
MVPLKVSGGMGQGFGAAMMGTMDHVMVRPSGRVQGGDVMMMMMMMRRAARKAGMA